MTVFLLVQAVLAGYDFSVEDAARDLGAGPIKTFFLITLPRIRTGVFTAMIFSFITSFGEFNIAVFLTATDTMTMPVHILEPIPLVYNSRAKPPTMLGRMTKAML